MLSLPRNVALFLFVQVLGFTTPQTWALRISVASFGLMVVITLFMISRLNEVSREARSARSAADDLSARTEALEAHLKKT